MTVLRRESSPRTSGSQLEPHSRSRGSSSRPRRPPGPSVGGCGLGGRGRVGLVEGLAGHGGPEEAGEFAGDGDGCHERLPVLRRAWMGRRTRALKASATSGGTCGWTAAMRRPTWGRLQAQAADEQPAGVPRAGSGDVSTVALVTGGVLAGGQAEKAHQLARGGEAPQLPDLGEQRERGQGRDAAVSSTASGPDRSMARARRSVESGDRAQRSARRRCPDGRACAPAPPARAGRRAAGGAPGDAAAPALLALAGTSVPVAQQLLDHAVTRRAARAHQIVATAHEVTQALLRRRRRIHELQCPGAVQHQQPLGVAAIGLYARARCARNHAGATMSHATPIAVNSR